MSECAVKFSQRMGAWYIADATGECVSSLYDTQREAAADLVHYW